MRTIQVQTLTQEAFRDFGMCANMLTPSGYALEGKYHTFYRDLVRFPGYGACPLGFSALTVKKNAEFEISGLEYHDFTAEIQMPLDDDVILVLAPANGGDLVSEDVQAFVIPKGTFVMLHPGVWHDVMYPVHADAVNVLIGLPERTYHNDIVIQSLKEPIKVKR